jgi:ribosomal 50S subunit-recycling heat shock protein
MKRHEEIQKLAYELFENSGRFHGRDFDHWLEAERIIRARQVDRHAVDLMVAMKRHEEIQKLANELFEKSGRFHGREIDHWLEAERIIKARQMDRHAVDLEAAASKKRAIQRSDVRRHEAKKNRRG